METCYASPKKADPRAIAHLVKSVNKNPILTSLLQIVDGCLAVLNEHRQILALNKTLLSMIGIDDAETALGLRPGEALQCVHAEKKPNRCGTTEFCSTCGAAIAIVTSLSENIPVEKTCAITVNTKQGQKDLYFRVRSQPLVLDNQKYLLLFLQDITHQQQRAVIERIFFHDINNIVNGLLNASEILIEQQPTNSLISIVQKLSNQLSNEVLIQQHLNKFGISDFKPILEEVTAETIMHESQKTIVRNPAAENRKLVFQEAIPLIKFQSNPDLICRILLNMIINALEASITGDTVKVSTESDSQWIHFNVWNRQVIDKDISKRIFQRNFSTKETMGRGWGTYSMKLLGEKILNGKIEFTSTKQNGTTFQLSLPI